VASKEEASGETGSNASAVQSDDAYRTSALRKLNITHMEEILRGLEDASHFNVLSLEAFGLVLIVKEHTFAGLFVCQKSVPPVTCLDYLTGENLRFLLVLLTSRRSLWLLTSRCGL